MERAVGRSSRRDSRKADTKMADNRRESSHPHFNDHGAVRWHTRLADALAEAKREGKFVFVEYGRYA
jgi:hypothetical protein